MSEGSESRHWPQPRSFQGSIVVAVQEAVRSSFDFVEMDFATAVVVVEGTAVDTAADIVAGMVVDKADEARRSCEPDSAAGRSQTLLVLCVTLWLFSDILLRCLVV